MFRHKSYYPGEDRDMEGGCRRGGGPGRGPQRFEDGPADLDRELMHALGRMSRGLRALHEEGGGQRRILTLLAKAGDMTQRELTRLLAIQPGSASELIRKMEGAGLLVRTESDADRRTANVSLTAEGRRRAEELGGREDRARLLSGLSEEEKAALLALLQKLQRDWPEFGPRGRGPGPCGPKGEGRRGPGGPRRPDGYR